MPVNPPAGQSSRPLCPSSARGRPQPPKVKNLRREAGSAAASYTPVPRPAPRAAGERLTTSSTRPSAPFRKHAASQGGGWRREGPPLLLSNHEGRSFLRDRERGGGAGGRARGWGGAHWVPNLSTTLPLRPGSALRAGMGGGREAPELAKNWSSGRRTKVSERAPQLGGEAGPGGRPRLGCSRPPSCARDGAGRRARPPPAPPRCRLRSTPMAPTKTRTPPTEGQGNNTRTGLWPPPPLVTRSGGLRDPQPRVGNARGRRATRGPLPAGAVRRRGSKSAEQGAADAPTAQLRAGTPEPAPQAGTPRYLAAAGGRRHLRAARPERDSKVCRRKVSPPTWGEDVGGARAEDGEQRWEDVSGRLCVHYPSPRGAG